MPEMDNPIQQVSTNIENCSYDTGNSVGHEPIFVTTKIRVILYRLLFIYIAFAILALLALLAIPTYNILKNYNILLERRVLSLPHIDDWDKKIAEQEKRLQLLTTESIDGRLHKVESLLASGNLNMDEIRNLQQISAELKKIKSDIYLSPKKIGEFREMQYKFDIFEHKIENKINQVETKLIWWIVISISIPIILLVVTTQLQHHSSKEKPTMPVND